MPGNPEYKHQWYMANRERLGYQGIRNGDSQSAYDKAERKHLKFACGVCGELAVLIHHIDGDHFNGVPENRMSLCRACHIKIHKPRRKVIIPDRECPDCGVSLNKYRAGRCRSCARKLAWAEGVYAVSRS